VDLPAPDIPVTNTLDMTENVVAARRARTHLGTTARICGKVGQLLGSVVAPLGKVRALVRDVEQAVVPLLAR
jgi:hypothetical protein